MSNNFVGANNLVLYEKYSRKDVGFDNTRPALMDINKGEKIAFLNIGGEYENRLTERGFFLNPRDDLNNDQLISELRKCTTYVFLRNGNIGLYYYVGTCNYSCRHDGIYLFLNLNVTAIPEDIIHDLGGFKSLP